LPDKVPDGQTGGRMDRAATICLPPWGDKKELGVKSQNDINCPAMLITSLEIVWTVIILLYTHH